MESGEGALRDKRGDWDLGRGETIDRNHADKEDSR
jgi:hypothetical protein